MRVCQCVYALLNIVGTNIHIQCNTAGVYDKAEDTWNVLFPSLGT